jgi:PadR family transcriptional regulator PadR
VAGGEWRAAGQHSTLNSGLSWSERTVLSPLAGLGPSCFCAPRLARHALALLRSWSKLPFKSVSICVLVRLHRISGQWLVAGGWQRDDHDLRLDIPMCYMYCGSMLRKELVAASAEPLILSLLSKGEYYGYAIIQEIKARSGDKMQWTDGMLYPLLHRMEHRGFIKSRWGESETGRKRKYYSLQEKGRRILEKHQEQWLMVHSVLTSLQKEQRV